MCPTVVTACRRMEENQQLLHQRRKKTRRLKKRKHRNRGEEDFAVKDRKLVCKPLKIRRRGNTAPQNTTQFLIEDKLQILPPEYMISPSRSVSPCSSPSSPNISSSSARNTPLSETERCLNISVEEELAENFDEMYFQKDFEETYDRIREESLMTMPRSELLKQYLALEMKEEELRKQVSDLTECACNRPFAVTVNVTCANCGSCAKVKSEPCFDVGGEENDGQETQTNVLSCEIEQLRQRNNILREENTKLKCSVAAMEVRSC